ncbi:MAG: FHA domain-containing protein [Candidatus Acidiferrales bacterium]
MQAACQHCGAKYTLDDKKVAQHAKVQFKCTKCGKSTVVDTRVAAVPQPAAPLPSAALASPGASHDPYEEAPIPRTEATQAVSPLPSFARAGAGASLAGTIVSQYAGLVLPPDKSITISVIAGPSKGMVHTMKQPRAVIGRSDADVEVRDPEVSRHHCSIEVKGDVVRLRDLDSTNGIYLDDERVRNAELQHLSEFRIGATTILVQITPKHE